MVLDRMCLEYCILGLGICAEQFSFREGIPAAFLYAEMVER